MNSSFACLFVVCIFVFSFLKYFSVKTALTWRHGFYFIFLIFPIYLIVTECVVVVPPGRTCVFCVTKGEILKL